MCHLWPTFKVWKKCLASSLQTLRCLPASLTFMVLKTRRCWAWPNLGAHSFEVSTSEFNGQSALIARSSDRSYGTANAPL